MRENATKNYAWPPVARKEQLPDCLMAYRAWAQFFDQLKSLPTHMALKVDSDGSSKSERETIRRYAKRLRVPVRMHMVDGILYVTHNAKRENPNAPKFSYRQFVMPISEKSTPAGAGQ